MTNNYSSTYDAGYDTVGSRYDNLSYRTDATDATDYGTVGYSATTPTTTYDTTYDSGYGTTSYDPQTGAYDQHLDYRTPTGRRHHRERVDQSGTYRHRDVDRFDDGTSHVHREYDNPNTGTSYHRDYER
ncbi:uncharacterized protein N7515_004362 [Penicillium bovifimosum]|uniref:Endo-1,3(4)-beta-glucanase n=1 Tax=Penicillium bovifimosum TaxID=126998 RepID=A0A9W9GZZ1_9EURO|nr:uncharacterized protein N7515_004362 [Penicillium bovifimosum]KAJ5135084.1 hypothetical protein N7515_004362 [Penicillium bovifimosum]